MGGYSLNMDEAQQAFSEKAEKKRKRFFLLVRTAVYIAIAAVVRQTKSSQHEDLPPADQATPQACPL